MSSETTEPNDFPRPPAHQRGADEGDLIVAALDHIRGVQEASGSPSGPPALACQEARLREWADSLGLLLNPEQIIPRLNRLEGIIHQSNNDLAIVTSQPRFDIIPVSTAEIDAWFVSRGFEKITDSAYYRVGDNLGVFDAHDKNLVRAGDDLIPFDVIPCHPAGGFLAFIEETLSEGHSLRAVRTVTTRTPS